MVGDYIMVPWRKRASASAPKIQRVRSSFFFFNA